MPNTPKKKPRKRRKDRKRQPRGGCALDARDGVLRFRYRVGAKQVARSTDVKDTTEHRDDLEGWRKAVGRVVQAGRDPQGFLTEEFFKPREHPKEETTPAPPLPAPPTLPTVRDAFAQWILLQMAPLVRKAQR